MRGKRLYFYLCVGSISICIFLFFLLERTNNRAALNQYESMFMHGGTPTFGARKRSAVPRLTPDLQWINKLDKQAMDTVPSASSPNCSHSVFLVILVATSPEHYEQRNAIRSSWGKIYHSEKNKVILNDVLDSYGRDNLVKTVFLMGRSGIKETEAMVDGEMELYGDIVYGDFDDNYNNLVYKTRLGLTWTYSQCPAAYVLKTDDDVFINIGQLLRWLVRSSEISFYTGWCNYRSRVSRNKLSKWYVSVDDYSEDEFPPYCLGGGYLISSDILPKIIKTLYTQHVFPLEDIFVGVAINQVNIQPIDNRKSFNLLFSGVNNLCDYFNIILLHPVHPREFLNMRLQAELAQRVCSGK